MIRTLVLVAAVSFVLAIGCFAGAFAIAGGPFFLDHDLRIHNWSLRIDDGEEGDERPTPSAPPTPPAPSTPPASAAS